MLLVRGLEETQCLRLSNAKNEPIKSEPKPNYIRALKLNHWVESPASDNFKTR